MTWSFRGDQASKSKKSKSKKSQNETKLETVLSKLALENILKKNNLVDTQLPKNTYDKAKLKYCLELAEIVMTEEQRRDLFSESKADVNNAANEIASACLKKIAEDYDKKPYAHDPSSRTGTGYFGIGARLTSYKKKLAGILNNGNQPKDQPLMDLDVALRLKSVTMREVYGPGGTHSTIPAEATTTRDNSSESVASQEQSTINDNDRETAINNDCD